MRLVTAIIKPFKLDDVRKAIGDVGVHGLTVTEVRGFGRQRGHTEIYRGAEYAVEFVPKTKIEIAVENSQVDQVIEAIHKAAQTGKVGDGKIFVFALTQVVRITNGRAGRQRLVAFQGRSVEMIKLTSIGVPEHADTVDLVRVGGRYAGRQCARSGLIGRRHGGTRRATAATAPPPSTRAHCHRRG